MPKITTQTTTQSPERSIRINIAKNTTGYQAETTVTLRWSDGDYRYDHEMSKLLAMSDMFARDEIARRQLVDDDEATS